MNEIAIVILSYTRPREVKKLIELCKKINFKKIYVCVDGNSNKSIKNEFLKLKKEYKDAIFYIREDNLGIRYGITDFIKKIFENEEASIFIEEDLNLNELESATKAIARVLRYGPPKTEESDDSTTDIDIDAGEGEEDTTIDT